jgi:hypothetical protein
VAVYFFPTPPPGSLVFAAMTSDPLLVGLSSIRPIPHTPPYLNRFCPPMSLAITLLLSTIVSAHTHDDMDMGDSGSSSSDMMVPYLHTTPGDTLLFQSWVPKSAGAVTGACIGLFLLAIFERWVAAMRSASERTWSRRFVSAAVASYVQMLMFYASQCAH